MNKQSIGLFIVLCISLHTFAQNSTAQKYARQITADGARKHLSIIASDEFEGRETGKPGAEKAANYIANEFKKLGLNAPVNGSYFQEISLTETSSEVKSFLVNSVPLINGKDFYFSNISDAKIIDSKEIIFIGYGIDADTYSDLKNTDITDKVVLLINKGEPTKDGISAITKTTEASDWSRCSKRIRYIQSKNPALILAVSPDVAPFLEKNPDYVTVAGGRLSLKKDASTVAKKLPSAVANITIAVADQILKQAGTTYEALKASIDNNSVPQTQTIEVNFSSTFGPKTKDVKAVNVLGFLPGSDLKDEIVVFSAHYDHLGLTSSGTDKVNNGADDDGSGTTGVLEIAKAFTEAKKAGKGPRRSILFLTVAGEEKGLLGSEWYSEHPVFPLEKTITDLNIDMIGRTDTIIKVKLILQIIAI